MEVQQFADFVSQVGFPIFVAGYMLIKQSKDTENMTNILTKLESAIENLTNRIEK